MNYTLSLEAARASYLKHEKKLAYIFLALLVAVPAYYILVTHNAWEDFFITFKFSKNLADGHGLVYMPGEKVYGYTSIINTLLLTLSYLLTGKSGYLAALNLYRIFSIMAFAGGVFYFVYTLRKKNPDNIAAVIFVALFLAFDTKTIVYASNGQEAGFIALFLLPACLFVYYWYERWFLIGCLFAGLLYTRPDGFVYWSALLAARLVFVGDRAKLLKYYLPRYLAVCILLYLPWLIFTWIYYGSPIPNTIIAKSVHAHIEYAGFYDFISRAYSALYFVLASTLGPIYFNLGGWPAYYLYFTMGIGLLCSLYWTLPFAGRFVRYTSFSFALLLCYLAYIQAHGGSFPWYYPPAAMLAEITLGLCVFDILSKFKLNRVTTLAVGVILCQISLIMLVNIYIHSVTEMYVQQKFVENANRKKIGEWLAVHAGKNDRIFLEPLGYIGYFSNKKMLDYPGLVSPEVTRVARKYPTNDFSDIIKELQPEWLVLRPEEAETIAGVRNGTYRAEKLFTVKPILDKLDTLYGIKYLKFDSSYVIYRRQD